MTDRYLDKREKREVFYVSRGGDLCSYFAGYFQQKWCFDAKMQDFQTADQIVFVEWADKSCNVTESLPLLNYGCQLRQRHSKPEIPEKNNLTRCFFQFLEFAE